MAEVKHYDPDQVRLILFLVPISGFGEDDFIEIVPDEDQFTEVKGVDGDITCSKVVARAATVNVTLNQSSKANALMWAAYNADLAAHGGAGVGPLAVFDENGVGTVATDSARIVGQPTIKFAKAAGPRVWKIRIYNYTAFEGGY